MMLYSSVPVARGSWHSPGTDGPGQAAQLGQYINSQRMNSMRQQQQGRGNLARAAAAPPAQSRMNPQGAFAPGLYRPQQQQSGQVSTGITQELLYPRSHINRMSNRAFGEALLQADPRAAQKPFMGRGLSLDSGTLAAATPTIAAGLSGAAQAQHVNPLLDQLANEQYMLQGQQLQGQQFMGLANILRALQGNQFASQQNMIGPLLSLALGG